VIAGVSYVIGKFWIINVKFSNPNDLSEDWDTRFVLSSGIRFIGCPIGYLSFVFPFSRLICSLPRVHKNSQKKSLPCPITLSVCNFVYRLVLLSLCFVWVALLLV
jgi:hypothetical protein